MRAVVVDHPGDNATLRVAEVAPPRCGQNEVRIAVSGAGVNRADLLQRRGLYPPPPGASEILGLECSGEIVEVGDRVEDFVIGERVMALLTGGGYAEQVVTPAATVMRVPGVVSEVNAGGVPEVFLTAFLNLFLLGGLQENQVALVHGGSGGVGTAAIQLIAEAGAESLVTAGSADRCEKCRRLGALAAFNYREEDWAAGTLDGTKDRGVDVVLDCVGARYLGRHLEILATGGRLVVIGLQGGAQADLDLSTALRKRLSIIGSTLRARPVAEKRHIVSEFQRRFGDALGTGRILPIVDRVLPFESAAEAHRLLAAGEIFGKVILTPRRKNV